MTIKNYTFFSPNGTEFPVGSNNDGKLYMMLTGLEYNSIRRKDWSAPVNTALNIQYVNTSIIAAGRYFELISEPVALTANTVNYIHANINLANTANPVSLSAEAQDNGNAIDLNNASGVYKVVIDIVTTNGQGVASTQTPSRVTVLDEIKGGKATFGLTTVNGLVNTTDIPWTSAGVTNSFWKKENNTITFRWEASRTGDGALTLGNIPAQYAPPGSLILQAPAFSSSTANDRHLQLNGVGAGGGLVTILNAVSGTSYRGQLKYDI